MGLKIYESVDPDSAFSTEGSFDNPMDHSFNGALGEVVEAKYYLRNDDATKFYSSITIQPDDGGDNIVSGSGDTAGFSWKLIAGNSKPLEEQWDLQTAGATISMSNVGSVGAGDTSTYLPFWIRIEIPTNAQIASYQDVSLQIDCTEGLVT